MKKVKSQYMIPQELDFKKSLKIWLTTTWGSCLSTTANFKTPTREVTEYPKSDT